jgi:hypothetical protein
MAHFIAQEQAKIAKFAGVAGLCLPSTIWLPQEGFAGKTIKSCKSKVDATTMQRMRAERRLFQSQFLLCF